MKRTILLLLVLTFTFYGSYAQKTITGKSKPKRFTITPHYSRPEFPPNLFVNLSFEDDNSNGILEPNEGAILSLSITNKGKGVAQGLKVEITDHNPDYNMKIKDGQEIPYLQPGQTIEIDVAINANFNIKTAEHKLEIKVIEHYGYDMDAAFLVLNTMKYLEPKLIVSGVEIYDAGRNTSSIIQDGKLQPGEQIQAKIVVQNTGQNISTNTDYKVWTTNKNVYFGDDNEGELGNIAIGEVKEIWVTLSPNKRVSNNEDLHIYLTMENEFNTGAIKKALLPIELNQKPVEPEIVEVKADMEQLKNQVARFEYTSDKITANLGNIVDIRQVTPSKTVRTNSVAIIMGIENYDNFISAPYAKNDAEIVEDYFKNILGVDKVFVYTNDEVSGYFFDNKFNPDYGELQKAIIPEKTDLFVYYSGHGLPSKDGSKVYLFPSDGRLEALSRHGYDINDFFNNIEKLGAKNTMVIIDACFSGSTRATENQQVKNLVAMKGVSIKPKVNQPWERNPDFSVFSSSSFNETSLGFDESQTGLFTYYLCAGLQGKADANKDNIITLGELKTYVIENVRTTSVKIMGKQTPVFHGNEELILTEY